MKTYAHIKNGVVENVSVWEDDAELPDGAVDVSGLSVSPGDLFDGKTFSKAPPPAPVRLAVIAADQFRDRFMPGEMDAVLDMAYGGDAIARRLLLKLQTSREINLDSPETIGGLDYLVTKGALTSARVNEVLA